MSLLEKILFTACLILGGTFPSFSQTGGAKLKLGINTGAAWQKSDVRSTGGWGFGLTLEKGLIENDKSIFGLAIRGRYLAAVTTGQDLKPFYGIQNNTVLNGSSGSSLDYLSTSGYVFNNYKSETAELSLEAIISLNRLRARTGYLVYVFGGIGGVKYETFIDQLDISGAQYDYSGISTTNTSTAKSQLKLLRDKQYETAGENNGESGFLFAPTWGIGFGRMISKRVYLGFEHKITYPNTDLLDAQQWTSTNELSPKKDYYHYSNGFIRIGLGKAYAGVRYPSGGTVNPVVPTYTVQAPVITIISTEVNNCFAKITANITNITGNNQIEVRRDGQIVPGESWYFSTGSSELVIRKEFMNAASFSIKATNSGGSAYKTVDLKCTPAQIEERVTVCHLPKSANPQTISIFRSELASHLAHGDYEGSCRIMEPPAITITSPNISPFVSADCKEQISATVRNIENVNAIQVKVNGLILERNRLAYNTATGRLSFTQPVAADSEILISASNKAGTDSKSVVIRCRREEEMVAVCHFPGVNATPVSIMIPKTALATHLAHGDYQGDCKPALLQPEVSIIYPGVSPFLSQNCTEEIVAQVRNVQSIQGIQVVINGRTLEKNRFSFNFSTGRLSFVQPEKINSEIVISASGPGGTDS
jgi:hypothetical protein